MVNLVFTMFNNLSLRYGRVFCYPSEGYAVNELKKPLLDGSHIDFEHEEICKIGSIDIETGVLTTCPPVRIPWESEPLPTAPSEPLKNVISI